MSTVFDSSFVTLSGNLDKPSALQWESDLRYLMSYKCADSKAHLCSQDATRDSIPCVLAEDDRERSVVVVVRSINFLPYRCWCNFLTQKTMLSASCSYWAWQVSSLFNVLDAKAIGFSSTSSCTWEITVPTTQGEASQASWSENAGWKWVRISSVVNCPILYFILAEQYVQRL